MSDMYKYKCIYSCILRFELVCRNVNIKKILQNQNALVLVNYLGELFTRSSTNLGGEMISQGGILLNTQAVLLDLFQYVGLLCYYAVMFKQIAWCTTYLDLFEAQRIYYTVCICCRQVNTNMLKHLCTEVDEQCMDLTNSQFTIKPEKNA